MLPVLVAALASDVAPDAADETALPTWLVVVLTTVGAAVVAGAFTTITALINRRPTQQAALLGAMQANRDADSKENQRLDKKIDSLYDKLAIEREYSMEWEEWHRAGMPDPPGRPRRPDFDPTNN